MGALSCRCGVQTVPLRGRNRAVTVRVPRRCPAKPDIASGNQAVASIGAG